jgi:hypothetical protein
MGSGTGASTDDGLESVDTMADQNKELVVEIGSFDRIQRGQNTLRFEKARCVSFGFGLFPRVICWCFLQLS